MVGPTLGNKKGTEYSSVEVILLLLLLLLILLLLLLLILLLLLSRTAWQSALATQPLLASGREREASLEGEAVLLSSASVSSWSDAILIILHSSSMSGGRRRQQYRWLAKLSKKTRTYNRDKTCDFSLHNKGPITLRLYKSLWTANLSTLVKMRQDRI